MNQTAAASKKPNQYALTIYWRTVNQMKSVTKIRQYAKRNDFSLTAAVRSLVDLGLRADADLRRKVK